jgi:hypothetical protein
MNKEPLRSHYGIVLSRLEKLPLEIPGTSLGSLTMLKTTKVPLILLPLQQLQLILGFDTEYFYKSIPREYAEVTLVHGVAGSSALIGWSRSLLHSKLSIENF